MSSSSVLRNVIQAKSSPDSAPPTESLGVAEAPPTASPSDQDDLDTQLAALVENAPVALSMFDDQMRYVVANRVWVEEFGLQHVQPLIGRSQYEIFPGLHPGWRQVYDRALQGHIVRSEHDAISGQDGKAIVYRWEVRPWRRKVDASVGGLMVICEKLPAGAAVATGDAVESEDPAPTDEEQSAYAVVECAVPMVAIDQAGKILAANQAASTMSLARGLREDVSFFWESFADSQGQPALRDQTFAAITKLAQDSAAGPQSIIARTAVDPAEGFDAATATSVRWLISRGGGAEGQPAQFIAIAVPGASPFEVSETKAAEATPAPQPEIPAPHPAAADTALIRELQEKLNRTRQEVTVLREAEQTFAKREGRQRAVLEAMPCGLVVLDERGMPIYHNQSIAKLLGRTIQRGESVEQWLMHACPSQEHKDKVTALWSQDVWSRQLTRTISLAIADGALREFEFHPVTLSGGGVLVSIRDVTEQCRTEDLLQATEVRFRVLLQESAAGVLLADKSGAVFETNPAAEKLIGFSKADLRRMSFDEWLAPESAAARKEALRLMKEEGRRSVSVEATVRHSDGSCVPVLLRMAFVNDADGELHCTVCFLDKQPPPATPAILVPLGNREPAGTSASASSPSQDTVAGTEPAQPRIIVRWLAQTDQSGRIANWSSDAQSVFGFEAVEAVGKWLHTIFRPSDPTGFYETLQERVASPDESVAWNFFGKDGRRGSARFVVKAAGEGGLAIDLFDEHETTAPAEDALAAGPQPRTHIVKPSQLWPVCDLDREKLLLSETHHRIKNHLQIISSMLNLQMNSLGDEAARSALRSSQNRVRSIAALHQHLYQLALGEGPGFDDFSSGLSQRLRECYEVPEERVTLKLDITTAHLQQEWMMPLALILNETLSNAFEHAFPDGRRGNVAVRLTLGEDGVGEFDVSDDGIGLPDGFDPAIAPGLGLKILGVFADQMRGQLRLTGELGQGTKFNLRFPMAYVDN